MKRQYGLVAEEVSQIYPELVVHDNDGKIESVRYSMLTSMLLNELQKQSKELQKQTRKNEQQAAKVARLEERLSNLEQLIAANKEGRSLAAAFSR